MFSQINLHHSDISKMPLNFLLSATILHKFDTLIVSLRFELAPFSKDSISVFSQIDLHYSDMSNVPLNFLLSGRIVHKGDMDMVSLQYMYNDIFKDV